MKKLFSILVLIIFLLTNMNVIGIESNAGNQKDIFSQRIQGISSENFIKKVDAFEDNKSNPLINTQVEYPWIIEQTDFLEWYIRIEYNGESFLKQVPVDTSDFREKFLKHPEYGESIRFDVDEDAEDDVEVIVGFYWSIIRDENDNDIKSLEKRTRVRLLQSGDYISDEDGSFEVWSELHVNYGLIKQSVKSYSSPMQTFFEKIVNRVSEQSTFTLILSNIINKLGLASNQPVVAEDSDSFAVGAGFRSPSGETIPRYVEKRFALARQSMFSPTIYQHSMDPGSSKGISSIELLYGYQAYQANTQEPSYDIGFSVGYDPAVYVKTKFVPRNGYIYYFFNDESSRNDDTRVSFTADINEGGGESSSLSLLFKDIDQSLAVDGRWMCLDVNIAHDNDPLGGSVHYEGSNQFTIDVILDTPLFAEKIKFVELPTLIDMSWDLDLTVDLTPLIFVKARGEFDIDMDEQIGSISVFYPKTEQLPQESIFLRIPQGLPRSTHLEAEAILNIDVNNIQASSNYVKGHISHECSEMVPVIEAYLPKDDIGIPIETGDNPIVRITDIPARSSIDGKLYWNQLKGSVLLTRNSDGPPDPIHVQLSFGDYSIENTLQIRNGYVDTSFKIGESGYFALDTSRDIVQNDLSLINTANGNGIDVSLESASADDFKVDWNLGGGLDELSFNDINFQGLIDRIQNLEITLHYQGKSTDFFLDWDLGQEGTFQLAVEQEDDLVVDFSQFGLNSSTFYFDGGITLSNLIEVDMSWKWQQGEGDGNGAVDPGYFAINKYNDESILKNIDFVFTYMDSYGVALTLSDLQFYLDLEWWKGDRLLPYVWLDYEVSSSEFDVDLLWTNSNGETEWYEQIEEW